MYKILKEIGKPNKSGESKIYILIKIDGKKIRIDSGLTHNGSNEAEKNLLFNIKKNEVEGKILTALKNDIAITKEVIQADKIENKGLLLDYFSDTQDALKNKLSDGRLRHYVVVYNLLEKFSPDIKVSKVDSRFLEKFEVFMRGKKLSVNTVRSRMSLFISVLHRAMVDKILSTDAILGYKLPKEIDVIPDYLSINEVDTLEKYLNILTIGKKKTIGMYFLLSCFAGYRISDLYLFDYDEKVKDGRITIRADKNNRIVSMPIHDRLKNILEYVRLHKIDVSEIEFRRTLKEIVKELGLNPKIHPHSGRHTFAMWLKSNNMDVSEVANFLGDTTKIAEKYARIAPNSLDDKILKAFKIQDNSDRG